LAASSLWLDRELTWLAASSLWLDHELTWLAISSFVAGPPANGVCEPPEMTGKDDEKRNVLLVRGQRWRLENRSDENVLLPARSSYCLGTWHIIPLITPYLGGQNTKGHLLLRSISLNLSGADFKTRRTPWP
jgi:hypothetical protein